MIYTEFEAGGKTYKLRLNTRNIIKLEKLLGCNPITIFIDENGKEKTSLEVETMVNVLYAALQAFHSDITLEQTYDIFDNWIDDGHILSEFVAVIVKVYQESGLFKKVNKSEKN